MSGEFDFIQKIRQKIAVDHSGAKSVVVGPGDDCAVLKPTIQHLLVSKDILMDGTDFILRECGPIAAGRKAMLANLSDIAAMAGKPTGVMLGLCVPLENGRAIADGVFEGVSQISQKYNVPIIGGDTNSWPNPLVISITILGEAKKPILRSGAKPGDRIFVSGALGGSILGRHLDPTPRINEAIQLTEQFSIHAMIDISDGLVRDLGHVCEESNCGAELWADQIPIHEDVYKLAKKNAY